MARDSKEVLEVEDPAIEVLTQYLGWTEIDSKESEDLRPSLKEPVLVKILERKIRELNDWISEENLKRVVRSITAVQTTSVIEANEKIQAMLEKGTTVQQDKKDGLGVKGHTVQLIDYKNIDNNDFHVIRQYKVKHTKPDPQKPDIVLFINGLPILVIECKSPTLRDPMKEGMKQVFRYQETEDKYRGTGCPKLFNTVQIVASTYKDKLKYGTNYTVERHWSEWKEAYPDTLDKLQYALGRPPSSQDIFLWGVCSKTNLLDLIRNFIVYEREKGKIIKKLAKYQQYRAVNNLLRKLLKKKNNQGGVIWHTQGSGKSLTMLWTAVKLRWIKQLENPTLVVVTDRTDLDEQIKGTFIRCGFPNPIQSKSAKHLQELLRDPVGQTIMTTIQKFQDATDNYPILTENENVFVLVDEAHRTQYKKLAANMRQAMKNATFIGFTGTPISKKYRNTLETFGTYVDVYDHKQSVKDGATVPIYYEGRMINLSITGNSINELFDRLFSDYTEKDRERIKKKYATPEAIATATPRVREICLDILKHFESHIAVNRYKAQIVACSRYGAIKIKNMLDELGGPESEVLISRKHNDEKDFVPYHRTKTEEQEIIRKFKEEENPKILVVCDKLLTGFDAPVEQVMYLDSPLKEHTLLQAIARVNRTYKKKTYGLIVDYWGVSQELQDALNMFTIEESQELIFTDYKKDVLPRVQSSHNAAINFFQEVDREDIEACVQYLEPEDRKITFDRRFRLFSKYLDMLFPDPIALPFVKDLKWLSEIRTRARNRYRDEQLSLDDCSEKIRRLIEEHIKAEGITQLIEPTSIFSEKFDEEVEKLGSPEAKASQIEHAIKQEIHFRIQEDPVYYESLKERLRRIIEEYKEGRINAVQQLKLIQDVMEDLRHPENQAEEIGVDPKVVPFYNLLKSESGLDKVEVMATMIYETLHNLAVVDWTFKEDIQREMRRHIKRILRTRGYSPKLIESTTHQIIDLAKARLGR